MSREIPYLSDMKVGKGYDLLTGEVPAESYRIPFGEAEVVRDGSDVTIVAIDQDRK